MKILYKNDVKTKSIYAVHQIFKTKITKNFFCKLFCHGFAQENLLLKSNSSLPSCGCPIDLGILLPFVLVKPFSLFLTVIVQIIRESVQMAMQKMQFNAYSSS